MSALPAPQPAVPSRLSRRRAVLSVVAGLTLTGVVVGGLWAVLAAPIHAVVALTHSGERLHDYLGDEADNFFVAAFLMLGLLTVVAVVAAVLVWQWQAHRGPAMVGGLATGMAAAGAAGAAVAAQLVHLRYGVVDIAAAPVTPKNPFHYVSEAPPVFFGDGPLQIACTVSLPAAVAALVYALLAAAAPHDDLGGHSAAESPKPATAVAVSSGDAAG